MLTVTVWSPSSEFLVVDGMNLNVVPLEKVGVMDTDMLQLSSNEMMMWAMAKLWGQGQEGTYAVWHSNQPVHDFPDWHGMNDINIDHPNFFEKAFPCLFLYGYGGLEADHKVAVSFDEHIDGHCNIMIINFGNMRPFHSSSLALYNNDRHYCLHIYRCIVTILKEIWTLFPQLMLTCLPMLNVKRRIENLFQMGLFVYFKNTLMQVVDKWWDLINQGISYGVKYGWHLSC